jgi:hypothetical protein
MSSTNRSTVLHDAENLDSLRHYSRVFMRVASPNETLYVNIDNMTVISCPPGFDRRPWWIPIEEFLELPRRAR